MTPILRYSREKHGAALDAVIDRHGFNDNISRSWGEAVIADRYNGYAKLVDHRIIELTISKQVEAIVEFRFLLRGCLYVEKRTDFLLPRSINALDNYRSQCDGNSDCIEVSELTPMHYASMMAAANWSDQIGR